MATEMRSVLARSHEHLRFKIYHVERTPYRRLRAEIAHPHWALSHVATGDVTTVMAGQSFPAAAGCVMVHPPGLAYGEYAEGPGAHEWIILDAWADESDLFQVFPVPPVVKLRDPERFSNVFAELLSTWNRVDPIREVSLLALTSTLVSMVLESWISNGEQLRPAALCPQQSRFADLIIWIGHHLDRRITREHLADRACLAPNSFDRAFRATYGVPPMQMVRTLRLQRARHLLESTDQTVETIATACGFGQVVAFTRLFRRVYHVPPGRYREGVNRSRSRYIAL